MTDEQTKQVLKLLRNIDKNLQLLVASQQASDATLKGLLETVDEPRNPTDAYHNQGLLKAAQGRMP